MAWDDANKRVLVKAIGTVESNLNYQAINYADPITVGFMQWYGTRAANIIKRISTENNIPLGNMGAAGQRVASIGTTAASWNSYYLTQAAGNALKPHLLTGKVSQQKQAIEDFEAYVKVAANHGLSAQNNTDAFMMWCVAYHQGPVYALQALSTVGGTATLDGMKNAILANRVLGRYTNRYNTAYTIIKNHDNSGIDGGTSSGGSKTQTTGTDNKGSNSTDARYVKNIRQHGHNLILDMSTGEHVMCYKGQTGLWVLGEDTGRVKKDNSGSSTPSSGATPTSSDATRQAKEQKLEQWYSARANKFRYAQAPGRLTPDQSGYTDCSACIYRAYMDCLGINPGTWTGDQAPRGTNVYSGACRFDTSKMKYGDLIVFGSGPGSTVHVEMYAPLPGQPLRCWGAGSAPCPHITSLSYWNGWTSWCTIRRHF